MRGEDTSGRLEAHPQEETPPHAWGRPDNTTHLIHRFRNTPTCVGKTIVANLVAVIAEKHPHMRGEDVTRLYRRNEDEETPPHAWGRLVKSFLPVRVAQKHPHMRGEDPERSLNFFLHTWY